MFFSIIILSLFFTTLNELFLYYIYGMYVHVQPLHVVYEFIKSFPVYFLTTYYLSLYYNEHNIIFQGLVLVLISLIYVGLTSIQMAANKEKFKNLYIFNLTSILGLISILYIAYNVRFQSEHSSVYSLNYDERYESPKFFKIVPRERRTPSSSIRKTSSPSFLNKSSSNSYHSSNSPLAISPLI